MSIRELDARAAAYFDLQEQIEALHTERGQGLNGVEKMQSNLYELLSKLEDAEEMAFYMMTAVMREPKGCGYNPAKRIQPAPEVTRAMEAT